MPVIKSYFSGSGGDIVCIWHHRVVLEDALSNPMVGDLQVGGLKDFPSSLLPL